MLTVQVEAASKHALVSISKNGIEEMSFDYDNWGRIDEVSQNGSEQKITCL